MTIQEGIKQSKKKSTKLEIKLTYKYTKKRLQISREDSSIITKIKEKILEIQVNQVNSEEDFKYLSLFSIQDRDLFSRKKKITNTQTYLIWTCIINQKNITNP